ncbi:hypothetical protein BC567DRAFT_234440 [Phyllosticta citribraziliensis]
MQRASNNLMWRRPCLLVAIHPHDQTTLIMAGRGGPQTLRQNAMPCHATLYHCISSFCPRSGTIPFAPASPRLQTTQPGPRLIQRNGLALKLPSCAGASGTSSRMCEIHCRGLLQREQCNPPLLVCLLGQPCSASAAIRVDLRPYNSRLTWSVSWSHPSLLSLRRLFPPSLFSPPCCVTLSTC